MKAVEGIRLFFGHLFGTPRLDQSLDRLDKVFRELRSANEESALEIQRLKSEGLIANGHDGTAAHRASHS